MHFMVLCTQQQKAISNSNASFKCNLMSVYNQPDTDFLTKNWNDAVYMYGSQVIYFSGKLSYVELRSW